MLLFIPKIARIIMDSQRQHLHPTFYVSHLGEKIKLSLPN